MLKLTILLACISALLAIAFMVIRVIKSPIYGLFAKIVASLGFMVMATVGLVLAKGDLPYGTPLILLGLSLGLVGDIVLDLKRVHPEFEEPYVKSGMISFSLAHAIYITAIVLAAKYLLNDPTQSINPVVVPAIVSAVLAVVLAPLVMLVSIKTMKAKYGTYFGLSMFYAAILIFVTIFTIWLTALNIKFLVIAIGMLLFLLSDLVLSVMYFVEGKKEDKLLVVVNHSLYYAAQILIASFIFVLIGA